MATKKDEHLTLICDIGELASLVSESNDIETFLQQAVQLVAAHLKAGVGSIYLYDDASDKLSLTATIGLNPCAVGRVCMTSDEGLVGYTMARMEPVCVGCAGIHPRFKLFKDSDEERYNSFLSVPICLANEKIGVLVVQHEVKNYFSRSDVMAMRAIASQLAGTIAHARLMIATARPKAPAAEAAEKVSFEKLRFVKGQASVGGFALAPAAVLHPSDPLKEDLPDDAFRQSSADFQRALQKTTEQLKRLQNQVAQKLPESAALIFEAHHMILKDPRFAPQILERIQNGMPATEAIRDVARFFIVQFNASSNAYIREKSQDIEDLARRLLFNLQIEPQAGDSPVQGHVVIAANLYPSDILKLASEAAAGIVFVGGGVTSHVAIIARSLKLPMVITNRTDLLQVPEGTSLLLDADIGTVYVNPGQEIRRRFETRDVVRHKAGRKGDGMRPETRTRDGKRIRLLANINLLSELDAANELKAEGVGLYRSEFPFIVRTNFPSEEEQRVVYGRLFSAMHGKPVSIRTLDVGGDKVLPYLNTPQEDNPELGLRSIRFTLQNRDIFDQQLRAILRAGAGVDHLGIMFPMISSIDEFRTARRAVKEAQVSLEAEGLRFHRRPDIGAMVETPAVVPVMDELAREADFFSIGTNDFIQYMLAVDRTNENVAAYYQTRHPAVLRSLDRIVSRTRKHGKPVSVCGEMAHQNKFLPFLLGIGIRCLSVDPQFLPAVQKAIGTISTQHAQGYAQRMLAASTLAELEKIGPYQ
jgi:phosphotransferase system enzyme I (PtsP)